jgi:glycerol-3-phosphate dehydrogenase (NAD(P)+)
MAKKTAIGIIGGTSTAATFAILAARAGRTVKLLPTTGLTKKKLETLHGGELPKELELVGRVEAACEGIPWLLLAVPGFEIAERVAELGPCLQGDQMIVHTARSFSFDGEQIRRPGQEIVKQTCVRKIGCLSGPFFPDDFFRGQPAAMAIASGFGEVIAASRDALHGSNVMLFHSKDLIGVELAGPFADIYAMAGGMAAGLGYGSVTAAFVVSRGLAEMARFGVACGAKPGTFSGLSGLGALHAALTDNRSAAYQLGLKLGKGPATAKKLATGANTREILASLEAATAFARKVGIPMPILFTVASIVSGKRSAKKATAALMAGTAGAEADVTIDPSMQAFPAPAIAPKGGAGKG